jgi:nucleoside-diphosphate-sugar epimerase
MSSYRDDIAHVAQQPLPWEELYGCNILITGATGLLGECITDVLMSHSEGNIHVWASGREDERAKRMFSRFSSDPRFHYLHWDVMQPLPTAEYFHYVIHAASSASPRFFATQPVETILSNILGIRHLMDYGIRHNMRRLLFVSTGEVYGEGDGRCFSEEYSGYVDNLSPRSCYPAGKRAAETLCASYAEEYGADFVVARPCHIYGPHFTPHDNRVYAQFIRNIINGEDIIMKSDGSQHRSWCYVTDAVSALLHILLKGESGNAYNVADPTSEITIRELAEIIAEAGQRKVIMQLPEKSEQKGYNPVTRSVFCVDKLKSLGWDVHGDMPKKIMRTLSETKKNHTT